MTKSRIDHSGRGRDLLTVTLKLHAGPDAVAHVTTVSPIGKNEPDLRVHFTRPQPFADGDSKLTIAPRLPGAAYATILFGQQRRQSRPTPSTAPISVPSLVGALATPGSSTVRGWPR